MIIRTQVSITVQIVLVRRILIFPLNSPRATRNLGRLALENMWYRKLFTYIRKTTTTKTVKGRHDEEQVYGGAQRGGPADGAANAGAAAAAAATSTGCNLIKGESGLCLWFHINGSGLLLCKSLSQLICTFYLADNFTACVMDISLNTALNSRETGTPSTFVSKVLRRIARLHLTAVTLFLMGTHDRVTGK